MYSKNKIVKLMSTFHSTNYSHFLDILDNSKQAKLFKVHLVFRYFRSIYQRSRQRQVHQFVSEKYASRLHMYTYTNVSYYIDVSVPEAYGLF